MSNLRQISLKSCEDYGQKDKQSQLYWHCYETADLTPHRMTLAGAVKLNGRRELMLAAVGPTCDGNLTGGSAEEAAFSSLSKPTRLRVGVAAVSFLPPFEFRPGAGSKFPRFHHFRG